MRGLGYKGLCAALLSLAALAALPAVAEAANTFVDASRPNNNGDCLTPATACKTIGGADGAIAKASPGFAVHVEPGTYAENVALAGGVSLVADSGNPVIEPPTGAAVTVTGTPGVTISGLTFASSAGPEVVLGDAAGNVVAVDNSFIDRTPGDANQVVGIRTTSTGAPKIGANSFTLLEEAVQVLPPAAGAPGRPEITANTINIPDFGAGVTIESNLSAAVTGVTAATLTGNLIQENGAQTNGVAVTDRGAPANPGAGATMVRNRILGSGNGLSDFGARGPVSLFGDVIAGTSSTNTGRSAITAIANGLGGSLTATNVDLIDSDPAIQLSGIDLALDSSIVTGSISQNPNVPNNCTITFSAGPTTSGNSCQTFQTDAVPSFANSDNPTGDFHLNPALDQAFIDQGNPAAAPLDGSIDIDGDPRVIDGICPIGGAVRDIGADEFNPGTLNCGPGGDPGPVPGPGGNPAPVGAGAGAAGATGLRAAALKRCRHKHGKTLRKCKRKARRLPV